LVVLIVITIIIDIFTQQNKLSPKEWSNQSVGTAKGVTKEIISGLNRFIGDETKIGYKRKKRFK
jgi:hypothetical protein